MKLVLVDLDSALMWNGVAAACRSRPGLAPVVIRPRNGIWQAELRTPTHRRARLPSDTLPDVVVVVGFNGATAAYPPWQSPLTQDDIAALAYGFAELSAEQPGDVAVEVAITLTVPQAVDDALVDLAVASPFLAHAGDVEEVFLFSKDGGLANRVQCAIGSGQVSATWARRKFHLVPTHRHQRDFAPGAAQSAGFQDRQWSSADPGPRSANLDLTPGAPQNFASVAEAMRKRGHLVTQLSRTPGSVAGVARMRALLASGWNPSRVPIVRANDNDRAEARTLQALASPIPPGGCSQGNGGGGTIRSWAAAITASTRLPWYAVAAAATPLQRRPDECSVVDRACIPDVDGPVTIAPWITVGARLEHGELRVAMNQPCTGAEHWWYCAKPGGDALTRSWSECRIALPVIHGNGNGPQLTATAVAGWLDGGLIYTAPPSFAGTLPASCQILPHRIVQLTVAGQPAWVVAATAHRAGALVRIDLIQSFPVPPAPWVAWGPIWSELRILPILLAEAA